MYEGYQYILTKVEDGVGTILFNRPQVGNAFADESYFEVADCIEKMGRDDAVGAIVTTGAGRFYSAGGDIIRFREMIDSGEYLKYEGVIRAGLMGIAPKKCPKPVIAMINGAAAGAGASFALGCDFRFMTPKSQITMAFINLGFPGDPGGAYFFDIPPGLCYAILQRIFAARRTLCPIIMSILCASRPAIRPKTGSRA